MDFNECVNKNIIKDVMIDNNKINSIREVAKKKLASAAYLPIEHALGKITLLYDVLRENLEAIALEEGYKIYNHECYTAFIKEILKKSSEGNLFDKLRKTRNKINYYGMDVEQEEAKNIIKQLHQLIKEFSE